MIIVCAVHISNRTPLVLTINAGIYQQNELTSCYGPTVNVQALSVGLHSKLTSPAPSSHNQTTPPPTPPPNNPPPPSYGNVKPIKLARPLTTGTGPGPNSGLTVPVFPAESVTGQSPGNNVSQCCLRILRLMVSCWMLELWFIRPAWP